MSSFVDKFPLDGEVYLKGDVRVYLYRGHLASDADKCAVQVKGEISTKWVDRKEILLPSEAV